MGGSDESYFWNAPRDGNECKSFTSLGTDIRRYFLANLCLFYESGILFKIGGKWRQPKSKSYKWTKRWSHSQIENYIKFNVLCYIKSLNKYWSQKLSEIPKMLKGNLVTDYCGLICASRWYCMRPKFACSKSFVGILGILLSSKSIFVTLNR